MKTSANSITKNTLERIYSRESQPKVKRLTFLAGLKKIRQGLMQVFVGSNDLRIWQTYDRFGNNWWNAYDPLTGRNTCVESEAEMRAWIEQHYHQ